MVQIDKMRILCKGFNFYNQLNAEGNTVKNFSTTLESDYFIDDFQISHTFSVAHINNKLFLYGNLVDRDQLDLTGVGKINKITVSDSSQAIQILNSTGIIFKVSLNDFVVRQLPKFADDDDVVKNISSNSKLNVAYTEKGCLYSIPERLEFDNKDIVDIQTGREHCILLEKQGRVFTFGSGSHGQLGTGDLEDHQHPVLVEALAGIKIIKIAAGAWHSAAITQYGDLYVWGLNVAGQLGLAKAGEENKIVSVMATPHVVDIPNGSENNAIHVACGSRHTIVLLDNHALYGCGWNEYKQIKDDERKIYKSFVFIKDFSEKHVEKIVCGHWNSAVICQ